MAHEIIYVCNSTNNKNVRDGELKILKKHEEEMYFEFGENEKNIKKRFYDDIETLNKDFNALVELKNKEEIIEKEENIDIEENDEEKNVEEKTVEEKIVIEKPFKKIKRKTI